MTETKNGHNSGNSFIWGALIGASLATLLTTEKGRKILRDLCDLGLEMVEDFIDEKVGKEHIEEEDEAAEDLESETGEVEPGEIEETEEKKETSQPEKPQEKKEAPPASNGKAKKRLFKGIKRK